MYAKPGSWPGRRVVKNIVRSYLSNVALASAPPIQVGGLTLAASADTPPLPGKAGDAHKKYDLFLECRGYEAGDAMIILQAAVTALHLSSDSAIVERATALANPLELKV